MFARFSDDHVAFAFKVNAPRILVVLGVLQRAGTAIQGWKEQRGFEACHDSKSWRGVKKRRGNQVKITVACVTSG